MNAQESGKGQEDIWLVSSLHLFGRDYTENIEIQKINLWKAGCSHTRLLSSTHCYTVHATWLWHKWVFPEELMITKKQMFLPSGAFSDALAKLKIWSSLTSWICFSLFFFFLFIYFFFAIFEALLEKTESLKEIQDYVIAAALEAVMAERASCVRGQRSAIPMAHWWKGPAPCPADAFPVPACSVCAAWLVPSHPSPSSHWDTCLTSEQDVEQESNFFFLAESVFCGLSELNTCCVVRFGRKEEAGVHSGVRGQQWLGLSCTG